MSRTITIWTLAGCGRCETLRARFRAEGFEERSLGAASLGHDPDAVDVLTQLAFQDHHAPVIRIDGSFVSPDELLAGAHA